jgi:hypothetical protein
VVASRPGLSSLGTFQEGMPAPPQAFPSSKGPVGILAHTSSRNSQDRITFVMKQQTRSLTMIKTLVAATFLAGWGVVYGQTPTAPQPENPAPQGTTRSPVATLPETKTVAPDATGAPVQQQTTGQAPNVSKKMGAEMESAGDPRASPDEQ